MSYINKTIWVAEGDVKARDIVVVVAEITDSGVSVSEETSTSSQQVNCSKERLMDVLNVHTKKN